MLVCCMTGGAQNTQAEPSRAAALGPEGKVALSFVVFALVGLGALLVIRQRTASHSARVSVDAVAHHLAANHRTRKLHELEQACHRPDCACLVLALQNGLGLNAVAQARGALEAATKACPNDPVLPGIRAEFLARDGQFEQALRAANEVRMSHPKDGFALLAISLANKQRSFADAVGFADMAAHSGRGAAAFRELGLLAFGFGDPNAARDAFEHALALEPDDLDSMYNLALVAQRSGRFHDAREGYLRVLAQDANYFDARYNLAVLAQSIGATEEAKHSYEKLRAAHAPQAMLDRLQRLFNQAAAPAPAASVYLR